MSNLSAMVSVSCNLLHVFIEYTQNLYPDEYLDEIFMCNEIYKFNQDLQDIIVHLDNYLVERSKDIDYDYLDVAIENIPAGIDIDLYYSYARALPDIIDDIDCFPFKSIYLLDLYGNVLITHVGVAL